MSEPKRPADGFWPGDRVIYVPAHAAGDTTHPDCERGVVSSTAVGVAFVKYACRQWPNPDQHTPMTSQATALEDLVLESRP